MEVDQDIPEQGTPPGTPFEEDLTPSTTQGQTTNPTGGAYTQNYYTPSMTNRKDRAAPQAPTIGSTQPQFAPATKPPETQNWPQQQRRPSQTSTPQTQRAHKT